MDKPTIRGVCFRDSVPHHSPPSLFGNSMRKPHGYYTLLEVKKLSFLRDVEQSPTKKSPSKSKLCLRYIIAVRQSTNENVPTFLFIKVLTSKKNSDKIKTTKLLLRWKNEKIIGWLNVFFDAFRKRNWFYGVCF